MSLLYRKQRQIPSLSEAALQALATPQRAALNHCDVFLQFRACEPLHEPPGFRPSRIEAPSKSPISAAYGASSWAPTHRLHRTEQNVCGASR